MQSRAQQAPAGSDSGPLDPALLDGLRRGELTALATAFDLWHRRVRVLARRLLGEDAAAEDVVQEVFAALPRAARRFDGRARLEEFVLGIAIKRIRRHRRAALRRRRALERLRELAPANPHDPERDTYRHQLGRRLAAALDGLPLPQRVAFVLCEVEEMTAGEAAVIADCPEPTIRTRLFHARRRLRDLLSGEGGR